MTGTPKTTGRVARTALTPNITAQKEQAKRRLMGFIDTTPFLFVSPHTYPLFAPYRASGKQADARRASGRMPRVLAIAISTLIHMDDPCWHSEERRLDLMAGWMKLSDKLGFYHSRSSTQFVRDCFTIMSRQPIESLDPVIAVEDYHFNTPSRSEYKSVTFTAPYVKAAVSDLREIPVSAVANLRSGALALDVLVLAALYVPERGRLVMPLAVLTNVLPSVKRFSYADRRDRLVDELNGAQNMWRFAFEDDEQALVVTDTQADTESDAMPCAQLQ